MKLARSTYYYCSRRAAAAKKLSCVIGSWRCVMSFHLRFMGIAG